MKDNDIRDNVVESDDDFVLSIPSEELDDINKNDENHIIRNNEISNIINQSEETENNNSSPNESASKDTEESSFSHF
jgi:hypothetical protein